MGNKQHRKNFLFTPKYGIGGKVWEISKIIDTWSVNGSWDIYKISITLPNEDILYLLSKNYNHGKFWVNEKFLFPTRAKARLAVISRNNEEFQGSSK